MSTSETYIKVGTRVVLNRRVPDVGDRHAAGVVTKNLEGSHSEVEMEPLVLNGPRFRAVVPNDFLDHNDL